MSLNLKFSSILFLSFFSSISAEFTQEREAVLDDNGKLLLHWSIDYDLKIVLFNLTCESRGFIGFGISPIGGMPGADIVIGGFNDDGTSYFWDMHATAFTTPVLDTIQDWRFIEGFENATHTHLAFQREWNTCDEQDVPFSNDTTHFIWAFGATDSVSYHGTDNRGTYAVNMLDPELPDLDTSKFMKFEITNNRTMPSDDTTYWCNIGRSPSLAGKHHIVAFDNFLPTPEAKKYTHHFTIYSCVAPEGVDPVEYFDPFLSHPGTICREPSSPLPYDDCKAILYVWGIGGNMFSMPENVGYPIGENGEYQYYMLEIHYDNPEQVEGVTFTTGATVYYTDELREVDAGLLLVGQQSNWGITIPPKTNTFQVNAHCPSECTQKYWPETGVNVFAIFLHSHLSGRRHRLRLFRDSQELPWVANDDNYDFNYQQNRLMKDEVILLPGDHLTTQCYYDTTWRNGTTLGGLASRDEMCEHFVWHYPLTPLGSCSSRNYPTEKLLGRFGIEEIDFNSDWFNPTILKPDNLANLTYLYVVDNLVEWAKEMRDELQADMFMEQDVTCFPTLGGEMPEYFITEYPEILVDYQPPNQCE